MRTDNLWLAISLTFGAMVVALIISLVHLVTKERAWKEIGGLAFQLAWQSAAWISTAYIFIRFVKWTWEQ